MTESIIKSGMLRIGNKSVNDQGHGIGLKLNFKLKMKEYIPIIIMLIILASILIFMVLAGGRVI